MSCDERRQSADYPKSTAVPLEQARVPLYQILCRELKNDG